MDNIIVNKNVKDRSKDQTVEKSRKPWFVYIIKSNDNKLYTGITVDMLRRWKEHSSQTNRHLRDGINSNCAADKGSKAMSVGINFKGVRSKGAKFFRGRSPDKLVFLKVFEGRSEASKKESAIKKLSRINKIALINSPKNEIDAYTDLQELGCSSD